VTSQADLSVDEFVSRTGLLDLDSELPRKVRFMHFLAFPSVYGSFYIETVDGLTADSSIAVLRK
jgi:hypothetical protein